MLTEYFCIAKIYIIILMRFECVKVILIQSLKQHTYIDLKQIHIFFPYKDL